MKKKEKQIKPNQFDFESTRQEWACKGFIGLKSNKPTERGKKWHKLRDQIMVEQGVTEQDMDDDSTEDSINRLTDKAINDEK